MWMPKFSMFNENTKKWWHLRSLEYGKGWHESKEIFQSCPEIEFATTNYCPIAFKAQQAIFLVEKELHYDNVIRLCVLLYFWCELPLRNASEGSLIILKMTAVKNCWKTTRIYNRIIRSIREQRFWEQRSFQICHYLCFLNSIFIFSESGKWCSMKLMKFWNNSLQMEEKLHEFCFCYCLRELWLKTMDCSFAHLCWRLLMK